MRLVPQSIDLLTLTADVLSIAAFFITIVIAVIGNNLRRLLRFRDYFGELKVRTEELTELLRIRPKVNHDDIRIKISEIHGIITSIPTQDRKAISVVFARSIKLLSDYEARKTDESAWAVLDATYSMIQHLRLIGRGI